MKRGNNKGENIMTRNEAIERETAKIKELCAPSRIGKELPSRGYKADTVGAKLGIKDAPSMMAWVKKVEGYAIAQLNDCSYVEDFSGAEAWYAALDKFAPKQ